MDCHYRLGSLAGRFHLVADHQALCHLHSPRTAIHKRAFPTQIHDFSFYAVIDAQIGNGIANYRQLIYTAIDAK
jgi:hypothetical protein